MSDPRLARIHRREEAKWQVLHLLDGLGLSYDEAVATLVDVLAKIAPRLFEDDLKTEKSPSVLPMPVQAKKNEYRRIWVLTFLAKEGPTSTAVLKLALGIAGNSQEAREFDNHLCVMHHRQDIEKMSVPHDGTANNSGRLGRWEITEKGRDALMGLARSVKEEMAAE